ncbi:MULTISPECIES: hypothetical protein [unclassified Arthrobacter]|uniref:hypothetical protein n=1 Tax=unclassified Arthrobacter TaxID=235627 RepID=UPI001CFFB624|nr:MULTISPECIES: hypothetical protein [unclassified Arthrobacter]MCB5282726.1 hypothetical protein [Arthrobacter sp. ES1]WGZ79087.1 hypothetical protein QI450_14685 [Arthrobacter sp. EM1]
MTRVQKSAPSRRSVVHTLDELASIPLNPATVASAGIVRAAFDALATDPDVTASAAAARAQGPAAMEKHLAAAGALARRSAEYAFSLK